MLKAAVIGCGYIAKERHIPAFKAMKKAVDLRAVCDVNSALAENTSRQFKIPKAYASASALFSEEDLDFVDICVPPQIHAPVAREAMEHGCHVIMEKPMALTTADCDLMITTAEQQGVHVCTIHNDLFHPPFLKARQLMDEGKIGEFRGMRIFFSTPRNDMIDLREHWYHKLPGGVIGETGPHIVYMSSALLGRISNVDVRARSFLKHDWAPFDEFRIELEGERGFGSAALSYANDYWAAEVDIIGSIAALHLDLERMSLLRYRISDLGSMPIGSSSIGIIAQMMRDLIANTSQTVAGRRKLGTNVVLERFVESLANGSSVPVTSEEAREAVRVMELVVARYTDKYGNIINQ